MKTRVQFFAAAALAVTLGSAQAATISVVNALPFTVTTPTGNPTTATTAFDIGTTSDMLIVSTHADTYTLTSLTYGGAALSLVPGTGTGDNRVSGIYILDLQTTSLSGSNNLVANYNVAGSQGLQVGFGVAAIASSDGNPIVVGAADHADGNAAVKPTLTLNVPEDDSFVFIAVGVNGSNSFTTLSNNLVELDIPTITSMGAAAGYDLNVPAGLSPVYTFTSQNTQASNSATITGASFYVVPEPTTIAILGAGVALVGLAVARRLKA